MKPILLSLIALAVMLTVAGWIVSLLTDKVLTDDQPERPASAFAARNKAQPAAFGEKFVVNVAVSRTPAALPVLRMAETRALGQSFDLRVTVWSGPEQLLVIAQDKSYHLYSLPLTVAAKLHARHVPVTLTNVNTWGAAGLVTSDAKIRTWRDLRGETIHLPQRTSPPEVLTRYFLTGAGLEPDTDVKLVHLPNIEIAQLLRAGRIAHGVLLEPQITAAVTAGGGLRVAFRYEDEWKRVHGEAAGLPDLGFGGNAEFITRHPAVVGRFEEEYEKALAWVLANPEAAGRLAEKHLDLQAGIVEKAVPNLGLRYKSAAAARQELDEYYRWLNEFSPDVIGDEIPDETFYWRQDG